MSGYTVAEVPVVRMLRVRAVPGQGRRSNKDEAGQDCTERLVAAAVS